MSRPPVPCPHCGADIDPEATFCRHCGSSDSDGWRDDFADELVGDEEADDDFDYDEFLRREGLAEPGSPRAASGGLRPIWRLTAFVLLILLVWYLVTMLRAAP